MSDVVVKWSRDGLERGACAGMAMEGMSGTTAYRAAATLIEVLCLVSPIRSGSVLASPSLLAGSLAHLAGQRGSGAEEARVGEFGACKSGEDDSVCFFFFF
ncbi:hypothetical protein M758_8G040900 [Ceratodon purpureus]|nr:hypothetical protein M758_8G040900 [Ceratodon purpureus]